MEQILDRFYKDIAFTQSRRPEKGILDYLTTSVNQALSRTRIQRNSN